MWLPSIVATSIAAAVVAQPVFDVRSFGAVGDGKTMNTAAFAAAIEAAHKAGKPDLAAQVLAADGLYLSGQIQLLSNVYLKVASSATLLASTNSSDYPLDVNRWAFIYSLSASNIGIVGGGVVDGQQPLYVGGYDPTQDKLTPLTWANSVNNCTGECRPRLVRLQSSNGIRVDNVTFTHSPDWTFHLQNSSDIWVSRLTQYGFGAWPNNDGVDIDSCVNVLIEDSSFDTGDDGVCPKSTEGCQPMRNVTVRNVRIRSRSGAIKFGSVVDEDASDLLFENITIHDSNRGLAFQQRGKGAITNVTFRNITVESRFWPESWWGSAEPLYVTSVPRNPGTASGPISNVTFENIVARSENSAFFSGAAPGTQLQGITLRNVSITITRIGNYTDTRPGVHDYTPCNTRPQTVLAPVNGLYVEGAAGLVLDGLAVSFDASVRPEPWWARGPGACVNVSAAGSPVVQNGGSCTPLPA